MKTFNLSQIAKTKWFRIVVVIVVLVFLANLAVNRIPNPNAVKAEHMKQVILTLPKGSSKAQVEAFLKKENIEASYVDDKEGIDFTSDVSDNGYSSANLSGYYVAMIRGTSRGFPVTGDTQYFFFFDRKGRLLKATTHEVFTGP